MSKNTYNKQKRVSYSDGLRQRVCRIYNKTASMMLVESILFIVMGVLMLINPFGILTIMTFVFGCIMVLVGFYKTVSGFIISHEYGGGWKDVLFGVLNVIIGMLFVINPMKSVIGLIYLFVILFVVKSISALIFAINMARVRFGHYIFNLILSILFMLLSFALLFNPVIAVALGGVFVAIVLIVYAIADLYMWVQLRRLNNIDG